MCKQFFCKDSDTKSFLQRYFLLAFAGMLCHSPGKDLTDNHCAIFGSFQTKMKPNRHLYATSQLLEKTNAHGRHLQNLKDAGGCNKMRMHTTS